MSVLSVWGFLQNYIIISTKPDFLKMINSIQDSFNAYPPVVRHSSEGVFKSEFRPRGKSFNYKHLRNPDDNTNGTINGESLDDVANAKVKKKKRRNRGSSGGGSTSVSPETPEDKKKSRAAKLLGVYGAIAGNDGGGASGAKVDGEPQVAVAAKDPVV